MYSVARYTCIYCAQENAESSSQAIRAHKLYRVTLTQILHVTITISNIHVYERADRCCLVLIGFSYQNHTIPSYTLPGEALRLRMEKSEENKLRIDSKSKCNTISQNTDICSGLQGITRTPCTCTDQPECHMTQWSGKYQQTEEMRARKYM